MSNQVYPAARQAFLEGSVNWLTANVVAVLVDTSHYTYNPVHATLADVPATARVASSGSLVNKTSVYGVADAADLAIVTTYGGTTVEALILTVSSGVDATSKLVAYCDVAVGLPVTTESGGTITVQWDNGTNRILAL